MRLVTFLIIVLFLLAAEVEPRRRRMTGRISSGKGVSMIGKGLASLARSIKDGGGEASSAEDILIAGKDVDEPPSTLRLETDESLSFSEWLVYGIVALGVIIGIIICLCSKMSSNEEGANW